MTREERAPADPRQERLSDSRQLPLFGVRQFMPRPYDRGSLYDVLERYGELIVRRSDFPEALCGAPTWCPVLTVKLELIRTRHGWSDREAVEQARLNLAVKACLGLGVGQEGPSQAKLSRHRTLLADLGLVDAYERRFIGLVRALDMLAPDEPALIDSTPIQGAGQVLDTFNLLGAALRRAVRALAKSWGQRAADVARALELEPLFERSTKAAWPIDWADADARRGLLQRLVDAIGRVEAAARRGLDGAAEPGDDDEPDDGGQGARLDDDVADALGTLRAITDHDILFDDEGHVAGIRKRPAGDRPISVTDPEMRHGRKSASVLFAGFKAQIVATAVFGWILAVAVIRANRHDGADLVDILDALRERHDHTPSWVAGDHAYGTLRNHETLAERASGPELIARMPRPANGGRFTKDAFEIDFASATLTCPAGHPLARTKFETRSGRKGWLFAYPRKLCDACPLRAQCVSETATLTGRTVFVVPRRERLIRQHLARREEPDFRQKLAQRIAVERVIAGFAQCGGKRARRFGAQAVEFDAPLSALAYNLRRLGALMSANAELEAALDEAIRRRAERQRGSELARVLLTLLLLSALKRAPRWSAP